MIKNYTQFDH